MNFYLNVSGFLNIFFYLALGFSLIFWVNISFFLIIINSNIGLICCKIKLKILLKELMKLIKLMLKNCLIIGKIVGK